MNYTFTQGYVRTISVKGPTLFELRRLLSRHARILDEFSEDAPVGYPLAVVALRGADLSQRGQIVRLTRTGQDHCRRSNFTPPLIMLDDDRSHEFSDWCANERYWLGDAKQRLSLLARLARLNRQRLVANQAARRPLAEDVFAQSSNVYRHVANVLTGFDIHLTVGELSENLSISRCTLHRWFKRAGQCSAEKVFQWVRMLALVDALRSRTCTVETIVSELGFSTSANARRALRETGGVSPRAAKSDLGLETFLSRARSDLTGKHH